MGLNTPLLQRIVYAFRCRPLTLVSIIAVIISFALGPRTIEVPYHTGDYCRLTGKVQAISIKPYGDSYIKSILCTKVTDENHNRLGSATAAVTSYFPIDAPVKVGQTISFSGRVSLYEPATNPGQFDYYRYNCKKNNLMLVKNAKLTHAGSSYNYLGQLLYELRLRGESLLSGLLNPVDSAIMKAMLFGNKSEIDEDIRDSFQRNGIAHILAISGLHISFMGMGVYRLLKALHLPIPISIIISESFIILYGITVGMGTSASRAICMFSLFLFSRLARRSYDMLSAMSVSLVILLILNRGNLWDYGFLLSFMAIIGISFFAGCFRKYVWDYPDRLSSVFASIFITLSTLPIILSSFYQVAAYTVLLNLIIIPLMALLLTAAIIMLLTKAVLLSIPALPIIARPLSLILRISIWIVTVILHIYKSACAYLQNISWGRTNIGAPAPWQIVLYYILLTALCIGLPTRIVIMLTKKRELDTNQAPTALKAPPILLGLLTMAVSIMLITWHPHRGADIYMLDVGQGDCMAIRTDNNHWYMIDGGSSDVYKIGEKRIIPFFQYMGVDEIEGIILTHPDADHTNGIEEIVDNGLLESLHINNIITYNGFDDGEEGWNGLIARAKAQGVRAHSVAAGDKITDGKLTISVIAPKSGTAAADANDSSLVLKVTYGKITMLTTADMGTAGENRLLAEETDIDADILKVAHHGSNTSSSSSFLEEVAPKIALISAPAKSIYGHPHIEVLNRLKEAGAAYYCTKDYGAVNIHIDGKNIQIFSFK